MNNTWISIITGIDLIAVFCAPFIIFLWLRTFRFKFNFLAYLGTTLLITAVLITASAWWADLSTDMAMANHGYDFDAMSIEGARKGINAEDLEEVKALEIGRNGVGWPVKAMMFSLIYIPYIIVAYFAGLLIQRALKEYRLVDEGETD